MQENTVRNNHCRAGPSAAMFSSVGGFSGTAGAVNHIGSPVPLVELYSICKGCFFARFCLAHALSHVTKTALKILQSISRRKEKRGGFWWKTSPKIRLKTVGSEVQVLSNRKNIFLFSLKIKCTLCQGHNGFFKSRSGKDLMPEAIRFWDVQRIPPGS